MSIQTNGPRDIVEGGPERAPNGQDQPDEPGKRGAAPKPKRDEDRQEAPRQRDDVSYQPESGQPGAD